MKVSKRQFVLNHGGDLVANPLTALRGHNIKSSHRKLFSGAVANGELLVELLYVAHALKTAVKGGAKAIKKSSNFCINSYQTEGQLIDSLDQDVEDFMAGLGPEDQETFETMENIHVFGYFPSHSSPVQRLKLSTLVRNGYKGKFGKGIFFLCFIGDSAVRTQELTIAKAKAKVNAKKVKRITSPNVIKAKLRKKTANKLAAINRKLGKATSASAAVSAEMAEFDAISSEFGLDGSYQQNASALKLKVKNFGKGNQRLLASMSGSEKVLWKMIQKEIKSGNKATATRLVKGSESEAIKLLYSGNPTTSGDVLTGREKQLKLKGKKLRAQVKKLRDAIGNWEIERSDAKTAGDLVEYRRIGKNIASTKNRIGKYNTQISEIKIKLGVVSTVKSGDFSAKTIKSKSAIAAELSQEIRSYTEAGINEKEALNAALQSLDVSQDIKDEIAVNAEIEMDEGTPVQIAVQIASQQIVTPMAASGSDEDIKSIVQQWL